MDLAFKVPLGLLELLDLEDSLVPLAFRELLDSRGLLEAMGFLEALDHKEQLVCLEDLDSLGLLDSQVRWNECAPLYLADLNKTYIICGGRSTACPLR